MAKTANTTLLQDLFDPEVVADKIDLKLIDNIRFAPLATIDNTLVGRPGDELTFPSYSYIGAASDVAEGADIPIAKLSQGTTKVKVAKIGKAVQFTDEALLSGNENDVAEEAVSQVVKAMNDKVESLFLTEMANATLTATIPASGDPAVGVAEALQQFGEDIDGEKVILVPAAFYTRLLKSDSWIPNTETGAAIKIRGTVGQVYGCQVVLTNRLSNKAYIVKPGALRLVMKRNTLVEFDRDKLDQTNFIIGSKIFAPYLYDASKLIEIELQ